MIRVQQSAVIHQPVSIVFNFVTDVNQFNRWVTGAVSNRLTSPEPFGVGSTFDQVGEFMNKRFDMKVEVIRFEPEKVFAYKCDSGPMPFEMHYFFAPEGEATRVTVVVLGETKGFLKMMGGVATAYYKVQLEGDLMMLEDAMA